MTEIGFQVEPCAENRFSFLPLRQTASHLIFRKEGRTVVVPQDKPLKPGTPKGIVEQAGLTLEQFAAEL